MRNQKLENQGKPRSTFEQGLQLTSRELSRALVGEVAGTRFLKLTHRGENIWSCILGTFRLDGTPVVYYADGTSLWSCLKMLGSSLRRSDGSPDKWAKEEDFELGQQLAEMWAAEREP